MISRGLTLRIHLELVIMLARLWQRFLYSGIRKDGLYTNRPGYPFIAHANVIYEISIYSGAE